ncbi:MAG: strawberry notch C-terminal domain-containing protein, partial [Bacteroidaceae bacterium]
MDSKNRFIQEVFDKIGNEKLTIISLRKIADSVGLKDAKDTELQEYTELAIIKKAKQIVSQEGISREDKYKEILQLYDDQPTISMRSSERVSKQQYSTPIPLSFIAGEFINGINPGRVLEPSAGNGMMVFNTNPESVIANEIDEVRLENLREQSFMEVTSQDGTLEFNIEPVDAVVTNPPFGKSEKRDYEGYKIAGLAEQMSVNALQNMKDDGRAAIIIGGNTKYNSNGTLASERAFLNYLYDKYNVIDVINIDGSLYRKQGTSFPVRMILANGRRTGFDAVERRYAPLQKDARSETIKTFDELLQRFNEDEKDLLHKREPIEPDNRDGRNEEAEDGNRGNIPERTPKTGGSGGGGRRKPGTSGNGSPKDRGPADTPKPDSGIDNDGGSDILDIQGDRGDGVDSGLERGTGGVQGEDVSSLYDGSRTRPEPLKIDIESEKTPYPARSKSNPIGSVVPTNMAQSIDTILYKFKDIDTYVQVKLGYETKEELFDALAAEQIDSVALAIQQIEKGEGLIIGDMTGVGKGRQAAAIIRYAVRSGKKPIFMTEKANLFSDMYRDLRDIGSGDLKPFIVNSKGSSGDPSMTDENGVVIYSPLPNNKKKDVINSNTIPNEYDYVAITYSQLNGNIKKKGASDKQTFFASIATDNILILDESHNAGGDGNTGAFMASVLPSTKGVVYLSATFAKRPDNMPIYALKTSMRDANMSEDELITAIQRGGVPLQEIMSKNLSETGQMVRRERDFTGVSIDWEQMTENIEENKARFDDVIQIFNDLIVFQEDYINPVIDIKNADLARVQGFFEQRKGTENMGISNTPFASKTFNLVRQMLFSLKAEHVANEAINEIKAGRKPVIAIGNTMETFLSELGEAGEIVEKHDYSISLKKGLDSLFKATETDANGEQTHATIPLSDLSLKGQAKYAELNKRINEFSSGITISPIDVIKDKITKAGYSIGEMTGRKVELVFDENGNATIERRQNTDKKKIARDFNGGDLDALIFNQAAATGISLHASNKFRDQKQRVMLFAQTQLDVNTEVQMRGRIDRTGQVVRGAYRYIISPIPAEQRMIMMFKAKLKSLDANTTSNQKSKANDIEIVDFLNKYGDEVLVEYLKENPEINDKLLDPLKLKGLDDKELEATVSIEGAASKAAGRAALLTVKEQESFYKDITDKYTTLINYLNDNGENDLEITVMPLNAETKAKHVVVEGKNNGNPFAENSVRETVEIDVIKKPMSISEIDELIQTLVEGKSSIEYRNYLLELVDERIDAQIKVESNNIQSRRDEKRAEHLEALSKSKNRKTLTPEEVVQFKKLDAESYDSTTKAQIDKRAEKIKGTGDAVKTIIKMFPAGNMVMVPSTMNIDSFTTFSEGMFLGFRMKDKITPSTVTAIFATLDGRRRIDVPLSKVGFLRAAHSESLATRRWMKVNRDNWDSRIPSRTRKTAYVITGNILQAYGNSELRGQLISYTTSSGEVKQGILLPERYKPDEQSMRVQVKSAADKLIKENMPLVDTSNGVSISREDSKSFSISVPLSKARGGKFYLDEGLRDLVVGRDFRQMAGQMVGVVKQDNIIKALEYLSDKFNISVDTDMKEINADELNSDKGKNNSKLSKEEDEEDKPKSRAFEYIAELDERLSLTDTPEQAIAVVTNMVNELESKFDTSAETVILPSKKAILDELTKAGASKESIEDIRNDKSVYFGSFYKGRIYINASAIRDSEDVIRVWSHENFHAWINNNSELLVPLMSEFETEELDGLIPENYLGTTKKTKLGELLAYSAEDVFAGRRFKDGDVQNKIKSLLTKYIDYATSGQFSERGASFGRNALAFRYNQGSEQEGDRTSQNGERADQRQETDRNIQKSDSGVPGTRKIDLSETINIDGVQRSTTNSDGKPIATTEQGVKNFWKWFGDSKVVDKDGRPLVVYHGTSTDINTFKGSQYYDGGTEYYNKDFSYFTPYKETAKLYAYYSALRKFAKNNNLEYDVNYSFKDNNSTYENQIDQFIKEHYEEVPTDISEWMEYADEFYSEWFENESNIRIIPVYLNIKNPKIVDDYIDGSKRKEQIEKFSKEYDNKLFDGAIFNKINDSAFIDGVLTGTTIIATSPNQIKSVDNVGTFSEDNDDIRFRAID